MIKRCIFLLVLAIWPYHNAIAETLIAARTLRANTIVTADDLKTIDQSIPGMFSDFDTAIGLETRKVIYAGKPISLNDLGMAAIVERNQIIPLIYSHGGLSIHTDGRSLQRAGLGEIIRVMNLASKTTITGTVSQSGAVYVGGLSH